MITIVSNNKCTLNVNVDLGEYTLSLNSVSGMFNPIIIDTDDWILFENGYKYIPSHRIVNISLSLFNDWLSEDFAKQLTSDGLEVCDEMFETCENSMMTIFPPGIVDYSDRFKHIYGEIKDKGSYLAQVNGPMTLFIRCTGIPSSMRFCNQTKFGKRAELDNQSEPDEDKYSPIITEILSINLNQFAIGFPFVLMGGDVPVDSSMLRNVEFRITDIYNNDIKFINNLIWTFILTKKDEQ